MKRILIITGIYPPDIGGPATFANELFSFINFKKDYVKVITLCKEDYLNIEELNIFKINRNINKFLRTIKLILTIRKHSKNIESTICCGLIFETFIGQLGLKNKKIYRFVGDSIWEKYLSTSQGNIYAKQNLSFFLRFLFFCRNNILNSFDLIITPSNYLQKYLIKNIKNREIKIINNFTDFKINENIDKNYYEKQFPENGLNFITLSRLVKWKNIDILIKAFKDLEGYNLHIFGLGPELESLKKQVKQSLSKNIFIRGSINRSYAFKALLNCDCFVQLSTYEGMSFSVLEALALNKPMLLSHIEPNFETAKSAAIYVNPNSISSIRNSLKLFKSPKIRKTISRNSNNIMINSYDKEKLLQEYYNEL
tara:strand:+ start:2344 stop:3444 length:1101 start_codon:yes stop_codon:yes gene_type:complete